MYWLTRVRVLHVAAERWLLKHARCTCIEETSRRRRDASLRSGTGDFYDSAIPRSVAWSNAHLFCLFESISREVAERRNYPCSDRLKLWLICERKTKIKGRGKL